MTIRRLTVIFSEENSDISIESDTEIGTENYSDVLGHNIEVLIGNKC